MIDLGTISALDTELELVDSYMREYLKDNLKTKVVGEILQEIMATSGKRLRPQLILMAGRFGPDYPACREQLCSLGALVELVHMASLIHDDIVDDSPLRRGSPTIQARFGKDKAVYAGDLVLSRVLCLIIRNRVWESGYILGRAIECMCRGEIGQYNCRFRANTTEDEYLSNIYGKTAVMFETACKIGAVESCCEAQTVRMMGEFGKQLGYAFQLRDDLLDFLSSESSEGKPVHSDFKEGIFTLPVLYTLHTPEYGDALFRLIRSMDGGPALPEHIAEMEELVSRAGGVEYAAAQIHTRGQDAEKILLSLPKRDVTDALIALVRWISAPIVPEHTHPGTRGAQRRNP